MIVIGIFLSCENEAFPIIIAKTMQCVSAIKTVMDMVVME